MAAAFLPDLDKIPVACTRRDLAFYLRTTESSIHRRARAGEFDKFEFRPLPTGPAKYSGDRIRRYLLGEDLRAAARPRLPKLPPTSAA